MNLRVVLALSAAVNVVLIGGYFLKKSSPGLLQNVPSAGQGTNSVNAAAATTNHVVRLDWRAVESADYKKYVQNLRAIGCPEETIFDIIVADVNTLFAMKARSLATANEWKYWEAQDELPSREAIKSQRLRRELQTQKRALLAEILGPDALEKLKKYELWGNEDLAERKLAFLAADKRDKLKRLQEKFFDLEQAATEWDSAGVMTEETMGKLDALGKQRRSEIESLLTAEELFDFDLRTSESANHLRAELAGFNPTEAEFRKLFEQRKISEAQMNASTDVRDPNVLQARVETEQKVQQNLKSEFGEGRYQDLQRSRDIDYQNTLRMTAYFGLPETAANDVYELKKRDQLQAEQLNGNTQLREDQRNAALEEMQGKTELRLKEILGDRVFEEYRRNNRWWMRNQ
ncbi:MAG: hypothetical protein JWM68_914 [Verrucomicrobiales bacterium]|nr:hypothetical protein [Verrucomicrobiales bacterium]